MSNRGLAPQTLALLRFVQANPGVSTSAAFARFEGAGDRRQRFTHRLQNLRTAGWLSNALGRGSEGVWRITKDAASELGVAPRATGSAEPDDDDGATSALVPPRQMDVMSADEYRPAPTVAYRAGAFDHTTCPSRVGSRSVPFWAGE